MPDRIKNTEHCNIKTMIKGAFTNQYMALQNNKYNDLKNRFYLPYKLRD